MIYFILFLLIIGIAFILEKKKFWKWLNKNNPFTTLGWFASWAIVTALVYGGFLFYFGTGGIGG